MRRQLRVRPLADRDIDDAAEHYLVEGGLDVAQRFLAAVAQTLDELLEQPHLGRVQDWLASRIRGCRRWRVAKPFDVYQVFYCPSDDALDVVRVLHGARDIEARFNE